VLFRSLAVLYYGVRRHKGFVVVTGEVGTGKTLLLRCLLRLLEESKDVSYAYVFNSRLTPLEFLQYVMADFGLPVAGKNKGELLFELGRYLVERSARKMTTVLVIDEAHLLSEELLEEVRLLSNLETFDDKLIQIVLVGQPELDLKLDSVGLRQLKQRIALRTQLLPMSLDEAGRYIEQRLQIAGGDERVLKLFPPQTSAKVFTYARGFPRLINSICENALVAAYACQAWTVTPEMIDDIARELRLEFVATAAQLHDRGNLGVRV
jgi:general secretion pathway protein A